LDEFASLKITHAYPKGTMLFLEDQPAEGVYVLCSGRAKLSAYSEDGRSLIVRIAEPGELLGLSAVAAGISYEASAQIITDCQVNFIRAKDFLNFLNKYSAAALNAIRELSLTYHRAHSQICSLGLSASVSDKLAKLLLEWYDRSGANGSGAHIPMSYTHEEIAEMIGTSRETVTRLLKAFRLRELIVIDHADLFIPDRKRLAAAVGSRHGPV
jgi:CRP/FNR family transcriptional regulator